ncbi:MAG: efflux RND transporter permease subunit, partial [bacterium]
ALAMPISIIATFNLLYFSDVTLNMMSLGGLALGIGMLVDNSIVVLENIFRHRQEGEDRVSAASTGAREVTRAVTASTLTTVSVFLPIIYVKGVAGQLFKDLALTVTFALGCSLFVSLSLLPMLASRFLHLGTLEDYGQADEPVPTGEEPFGRPGQRKLFLYWIALPFRVIGWFFKFFFSLGFQLLVFWVGCVAKFVNALARPVFKIFDRYFERFAQGYHKVLVWSLDNRGKILAATVAVFLGCLSLGLRTNRELMPKVDQGQFTMRVKLPMGSTLEGTDDVVRVLERWLLELDDVEVVFSGLGLMRDVSSLTAATESAGNTAELKVRLKDGRNRSTEEVMEVIREKAESLAGVEVTFDPGQTTLQQVLGTAAADIAVKINGHDLQVSRGIAQAVSERMSGIEGLYDIHTSLEEGKPEIEIEILRERANQYGLSVRQIATYIQNSMKGKVATQFKEFDRKIDVLVRLDVEDRDEFNDLLNLGIPLSKSLIPLRDVIRYRYSTGPNEIRREDQQRQVVVYANLSGRSLNSAIPEIERKIANIERPLDYQITVGGENEEMRRSFRSLLFALLLAVILVYMILAAQFESLIHPFTIMFTVPMALIGVVIALGVTGQSLNVMSAIGVIVLTGIVVNDAIVKVDFINRLRKKGLPVREAIIQAGKIRLRPILMTTVTTVLALTPMALGIGKGAELRSPLAIAVIGGLTSATFLTLVIIPVIYSYLDRLRKGETRLV